MKRNAYSLILIGVLAFIAMAISPVSAAGGITHLALTDDVLTNCYTPVCTVIKNNRPEFLAGMGWVDTTVPYYYTDFNNYQSTHMWVVGDECIKRSPDDKHKSLCYGIMAHLAVDSAYHNYLIPSIIRKEFWGNDWILHPIQEAVIEDSYIQRRGVTYGFMGAIDPYIPFLNSIVGKDLTSESLFLKDVYGSTDFYDDVYGGSSGSNWKYDVYKASISFVSNIPLVSSTLFYGLNDREVTETHNRAKTNLNYVFNGITPPKQNPTGSGSIGEADSAVLPIEVKLPFYIVIMILGFYINIRYVLPRVIGLFAWLFGFGAKAGSKVAAKTARR
jgi:hypothetical protein